MSRHRSVNVNPKSLKNLRPFKKGPDPNRPKGSPVCIERMAWTNLFLNALAKKLKPENAADILIEAYEAKRPWAITEVHERIMGKVTQPVGFQGQDGQVMNKLIVEVVHVQDGPSNGGGDGDGQK